MGSRRLLVSTALAIIAAAMIFLAWPTPPPGVTIENFRRLRSEMTEDQAIAIFGRRWDMKLRMGRGGSVIYWQGPGVTFQIFVDDASGTITGGETISGRHNREFLGETSFASWWTRTTGPRKVFE